MENTTMAIPNMVTKRPWYRFNTARSEGIARKEAMNADGIDRKKCKRDNSPLNIRSCKDILILGACSSRAAMAIVENVIYELNDRNLFLQKSESA